MNVRIQRRTDQGTVAQRWDSGNVVSVPRVPFDTTLRGSFFFPLPDLRFLSGSGEVLRGEKETKSLTGSRRPRLVVEG